MFQHLGVEDLEVVLGALWSYSPLLVETEKNILKKSIKIKYIPKTMT